MSALIGIAPDIDAAGKISVESDYRDAVARAGADPIVLERADDPNLERVGGLLLCGGAFDIPPSWYGQSPRARIDPPREARNRLERALLASAEQRGLAVLGICGGAQLMAVHRGGSLIQDVRTDRPEALDHERGALRTQAVHDVELARESRFAALVGSREIGVNSSHHQSIDRPGRNVSVAGRAPDGIIEVIEDTSRPFWIGVQWHPERMGDAASSALFGAFVAASRAARTRRA